jgi:serine/threonine protein kinase/formylglycine-generating enzyme required for sulfatase activity/dienelactone hydrolase
MANQQQSAEDLFEAALDLPPERRPAFLDQACRDAPELRRQVDELLLEEDRAAGFLSSPAFTPPDAVASVTTSYPIGLAAGTRLGRYSIIEPLGAGGMGVVYRARDEKLERDVAIKILAPGVLMNGDARERFRKEALALAKLSHPHIAAVYDVGEQDGVDYIVMECVAGEPLSTKLKDGPLTVKIATSIALQIAEALEEAHERGVVHRDLKPANVMVTPKGQVKVLDFGIAKLLELSESDATRTIPETRGLLGTPLYMSPEQVHQRTVDARTDLWSLGVLYYESLAGSVPFRGDSNIATLRAIAEQAPVPLRQLRHDAPERADRIVSRALEKDPDRRYQSASEMVQDTSALLAEITATSQSLQKPAKRTPRMLAITSIISLLLLILLIVAGRWLYHSSKRQWAHEEAIPQINTLLEKRKPLAAFLVLEAAEKYLPDDPQLKQLADNNTRIASITSSPAGATVEIQDYVTPPESWHRLGVTPLQDVRIPNGYFRWRISKPGVGEVVVAPPTEEKMNFALDALLKSPHGMVFVPGGPWRGEAAFVGWLGPYNLPPYYVDRYEVTNREYQNFVDSGGYGKKQYWTEAFAQNGRTLSWDDAMAQFRDTTGRPGPSTWIAGHYPEGKADFPVTGVSWFEAAAYASFSGKNLPVLAQWLEMAPPDFSGHIVPASNLSSSALAPVGTYQGIGPYGTFDAAGNASEWAANIVDNNLRFVLGGSWKSPGYQYFSPEELSPFDRSDENGFRCVQNLGPIPEEAKKPVTRIVRDFSHFKPVPDSVFHAYELLYAYPKMPLNATVDGIVNETVDWREEKVTFDTGYRGERMSAYLFLPKKVRPPYQTVLFFPSARVYFIPDNKGGRQLGDIEFFDYVVQSGRAVMYPIYEGTYERKLKFSLPSGSQSIQLTTDWYKDAARTLDYLATRSDIDNSKLAYLGVSMGSADGVIVASLLQDRLKTAVFLDGGYFFEPPPPGADQAEFVTRMKMPVLMVNGRYDFTFPLDKSQNPFFAMLGTPEQDKRHVVLDTPHDVTEQRPQLTKAVLDWLDHYLGRVKD